MSMTDEGPRATNHGTDDGSRQWRFRFFPATDSVIDTLDGEVYKIAHKTRRTWQATPGGITKGRSLPIDVQCYSLLTFWPASKDRAPNETYTPRNDTGTLLERLPPSFVEVLDHEELSRSSGKLLLVSDGGVRDKEGSFGWVIGTESRILVRGKGRVFGSPITSFRAEAFARWDALRWLHGWVISMPSQVDLFVLAYTDSKSLLDTEATICASWFVWTPTSSFRGDYDILSMLREEVRWFGLRMKSEFVKGHQDDNKSVADLPRPAQLNVAADALATDAFTLPTPPENWALPGTRYFLVAQETKQCLTSTEKTVLKTRGAELDYAEYMASRLPGGHTTVRDIDWDALRLARLKTRGPAARTTLQWLHGWLPLNERLHRFDDTVPNHCVSCKNLEDQDHLWRCPSRREMVEQRLDMLHGDLAFHCNDSAAGLTIVNALSAWAQSSSPAERQHPDTDLTWAHAARGLLSAHWSRLLCEDGLDGRKTCGRILTTLLETTHELWTARNEVQHASDVKDEDNRERQRALRTAEQWFQLRDNEEHQHHLAKDVLNSSVQELTTKATEYVVDWVNARQKSIRLLFPRMMPTFLSQPEGTLPPPAPGEQQGARRPRRDATRASRALT